LVVFNNIRIFAEAAKLFKIPTVHGLSSADAMMVQETLRKLTARIDKTAVS
jgi:hypothetical protein